MSRKNSNLNGISESDGPSALVWEPDISSQQARRRDSLLVGIFALAALMFIVPTSATATTDEDYYIAGYSTAILEREFKVRSAIVKVKDGVVTLVQAQLGDAQARDRIVSEISTIKGVVRVELSQAQIASTPLPRTHPRPDEGVQVQAERSTYEFLPKDKLFRPFLADPL